VKGFCQKWLELDFTFAEKVNSYLEVRKKYAVEDPPVTSGFKTMSFQLDEQKRHYHGAKTSF
jgi:hypothetical protein